MKTKRELPLSSPDALEYPRGSRQIWRSSTVMTSFRYCYHFWSYIILLIVPMIDPKNNISKMGNKYYQLKAGMTVFMSALAVYIIHFAQQVSATNPNYIVLLIGVLFLFLGNYFQTIKSNYYIGIRTSGTLEHESIWRSIHQMGGKLWFVRGALIVLTSLIFDKSTNFILFAVITGILTLVPVISSYLQHRMVIKSDEMQSEE